MMTKKLSVSFLSVAIAFGALLTGCADSQAKENTTQQQQQQASTTEEENPLDKITVSAEHEKWIKAALEAAKQGKQLEINEQHKQISWGEIEKVLGDPSSAGVEDGGSLTYEADKYTLTFLFNCHGSCVESETEGLATKLVAIKVEKA
jgi:hypothetical protein